MSFFQNGLKAKVMSTELIIEANVTKKTLFKALAFVKEFEAKYSAYRDDSLVAKINNAAGLEAITCENEALEIFEKALEIAKLCDGSFDPTIGVLTQGLYGFGTSNSKIPSEKELTQAKKLVDYKKLLVQNNSVYLQEKGMKLDLGGIGKGFIADKLAGFLQSYGAAKALISAGGEIVTFGKSYAIGIKDPFSGGNFAVIKTLKKPLSISTSGDYERYIGTKEHHHILDNKSAKQNHHYSSITLIKNGVDATTLDAVATIAFNAPADKLQTIAKQFDLAIIAVTPNKEVHIKNLENLEIKGIDLYPFQDTRSQS